MRFAAGIQEVGRHEVGIILKGPDGSEVVRIDGEMNLAPGPSASGGAVLVPHVLNMDGLVFPVSGQYAFDVRVDGEHQVSIPLTVHGPESSVQA